jgi:hypothetical protein
VLTTTEDLTVVFCSYLAADRRCFRAAPNGRRRIILFSSTSISSTWS